MYEINPSHGQIWYKFICFGKDFEFIYMFIVWLQQIIELCYKDKVYIMYNLKLFGVETWNI